MVRTAQFILLFVAIGLLAGCPNPVTGKTDLWLTAKTVINQSKMGLPIADVLFTQWTLSQTDQEKVQKVTAKYSKIKLAVFNGLNVAYDGVVIAEQAKTDPDMVKLMDQAEKAWQDLRKFIEDLLKPEAPATQPTTPKVEPKPGVRAPSPLPVPKPVMELKDIDLKVLPKTLLPNA